VPWNLPSGDTSTVGEYRKEQSIHAGTLLKYIQHSLGTFIHKRNRSNLDADHLRGRGSGSLSQSGHGQSRASSSGNFHKLTATDVWGQHGFS
jgi:hypothetical protein